MKLSFRHFALLSIFAVALFGARSVPVSPGPEPGRLILERPLLPVPARNSRWQEQALLLAGRPLPPESPFYELSLCPSFLRHAAAMEVFWDQVRRESLDAMVVWREKNVPRELARNPVLYPLSGADYLNAFALFPQAPEYTFIALEAPGTLPDLYQMTEADREAGLASIRRAVATVASVNYMKSKILRKELSNSYIPGTLPVFLLLAGGLGHTVADVRPIILDKDGAMQDSRWDGEAPNPQRESRAEDASAVHGLRITIRIPESREMKTIVYLQARLRKEAVSGDSREGKYLLRIRHCNTIFKAAVYLLHDEQYGDVREFVLDRSDLILQDDSGLPYEFFHPDEWAEHLFGSYTRVPPLGGIPNPPQQPVLARRFRERSEPISFPYGYGVLQGKGKSNLMLFVKKSLHADLR